MKMLVPVQVEVVLEAARSQQERARLDGVLVVGRLVVAGSLPVHVPHDAGGRTGHVGGAVDRHQFAILVLVRQARD